MGFAEVVSEEDEVGDVGYAVGAVGDLGSGYAVEVADGDAEDLAEAEGDDGEVVAAEPEGRCADDDAEDEETAAPVRTAAQKGKWTSKAEAVVPETSAAV